MCLRKGAFFHGAKADGCFPGLLAERIGLELDAMRAQPFERMGQQQELGLVGRVDVAVSGAPHHLTAPLGNDHERE